MNTFLKFSNYNKPSKPNWKLIGDLVLFAVPLYVPIIMSLPIKDSVKLWVIASMSFASATVKIVSKFTLDPEYVEPTVQESNKQ